MSEERYDITCDDILARVEYPSGCAASFFADGSASDRFAFAAIRQQARDIAELRAQLAESSAATADQRASMTQHADELYAAVTDLCDERDKLRTDLAAAVAERDRLRHYARCFDEVRLERNKLRARLAAIDVAPMVITITPMGWIHETADNLPIGTELIARPAKES